MKKAVELEHFQGPLDLLLQLIETKELEITKIAISEVTEQFIEYMEEVEERFPDELADFLVIATRLLLLKSAALLPYLQLDDEEEDPNELEAQLKMYKKYLDAMGKLEDMLKAKKFLHPRKVSKQQQEVVFNPPEKMKTDGLRKMFVSVLESLEPVVRIPKAAVEKVTSVREKFCQIQEILEKNAQLQFKELLADSNDKAEVVVTFLALLELVKKQSICVRQDQPLANITIEKL